MFIGGAVSKNEGSENARLWVQGDCRCRSPSLQLHTTHRMGNHNRSGLWCLS